MNYPQTFEPIAYLRFLRDFEVPNDEYVPIISNERFIEWESYFSEQSEETEAAVVCTSVRDLRRQSETVFHRCVFECFLGELERSRPYGERGRPYPWEEKYSHSTVRQIPAVSLPRIFERARGRMAECLSFRCGLIAEQLCITCEEELERAHEENEDRIIEMLEHELAESSHAWYELEEHSL
jgi:hypothetical protein